MFFYDKPLWKRVMGCIVRILLNVFIIRYDIAIANCFTLVMYALKC